MINKKKNIYINYKFLSLGTLDKNQSLVPLRAREQSLWQIIFLQDTTQQLNCDKNGRDTCIWILK